MKFLVDGDDPEVRVDILVALKTDITRSRVKNLVDAQRVRVNGCPVKAKYTARAGDLVEIEPFEPPPETLVPEDLGVRVFFSDGDIAVVDKPAGMVVYPSAGHPDKTLLNALTYSVGPINAPGGPLRPGVVHRLDRDTSGVMVVALSKKAYYSLVDMFARRTMSRVYNAIIYGTPPSEEGEIALGIGRSPSDRKKMSVHAHSTKEALTRWRTLRSWPGAALIEARLSTGRTHQIRVHFSAIGHPLLGDTTYGGKSALRLGGRMLQVPRQMLHARTLGFEHPLTKEPLMFESPPPEDFEIVREALDSTA